VRPSVRWSVRCESVPCEVTTYVAESNCVVRGAGWLRRSEAGWGAAGGEWIACRNTNPIRRCAVASLLGVWAKPGSERSRPDARGDRHVTFGRTTWLGIGCPEGQRMDRRGLSRCARRGRSQSPHSTAAAMSRGRCGEQSRTEGRQGRKVDAEWIGTKHRKHRQCPQGLHKVQKLSLGKE